MPEQSDRGRSPQGTRRFWLLVRAGPLSISDAGGAPSALERRLYDIRQFNPLSGTDRVVYLGEYHAPERVLRQWFSANRTRLREREVNQRALTYALSGEFEAAWQRIRDEPPYDSLPSAYEDSGEPDGSPEQMNCPKCGASVGNLPNHLRSCEGE